MDYDSWRRILLFRPAKTEECSIDAVLEYDNHGRGIIPGEVHANTAGIAANRA